MVADQCWYPSPHQHRFLDRASSRPPPRLLYIHRWERFLGLGQKSAGQCLRAMPWIGLPPSQTASFASPTLPLLPRASAPSEASLSLLPLNSLVPKGLGSSEFSVALQFHHTQPGPETAPSRGERSAGIRHGALPAVVPTPASHFRRASLGLVNQARSDIPLGIRH